MWLNICFDWNMMHHGECRTTSTPLYFHLHVHGMSILNHLMSKSILVNCISSQDSWQLWNIVIRNFRTILILKNLWRSMTITFCPRVSSRAPSFIKLKLIRYIGAFRFQTCGGYQDVIFLILRRWIPSIIHHVLTSHLRHLWFFIITFMSSPHCISFVILVCLCICFMLHLISVHPPTCTFSWNYPVSWMLDALFPYDYITIHRMCSSTC